MAQRLANIAPPGSLLKGGTAKPKRRTDMGRSPREHDGGYLDSVRQCPCLKCGQDPAGEAAHVRMASAAHGKRASGIGEKPDDKWALPLCHTCHMEQHRAGEREFWDGLGINPLLICQALYRLAPNVEGMRAAVFAATAIGGKE